jgi:hypothetical protein
LELIGFSNECEKRQRDKNWRAAGRFLAEIMLKVLDTAAKISELNRFYVER